MKDSDKTLKDKLIENRVKLDKVINIILKNGFNPRRAEELFILQDKRKKLVEENERR